MKIILSSLVFLPFIFMSRRIKKRKASWHVRSGDEKRLAVELTGGAGRRKMGPQHPLPVPAPTPSAPSLPLSERTLRRYRHEIREEGGVHEPLPKGHPPPKRSEGERKVVGGKVLWRWVKGKVTDLEFVIAWIHEKFGEDVSTGFASSLLSTLHLVSKAVAEKPLKFFNPKLVDELTAFLAGVHTLYHSGLRLQQLVAIDVCYWTNSGVVQRTYGPQGRFVIHFSLLSSA